MTTKQASKMSRSEIRDALSRGGFVAEDVDADAVVAAIQRAARAGALLWTRDKIVTTDRSRLSLHRIEDPTTDEEEVQP